MRKLVPIAGMLAAVVCMLNACDPQPRKEAHSLPEPAQPAPPQHAATLDPATTGAIRGAVKFHGPKPLMPVIDFSSNPQCERAHPKPMSMETVVVNANHTLRDTFVWLKAGVPRREWPMPSEPARLDQVGCVYEPHVLALRVNQDLEIANSDPVNHDVHLEAVKNRASNESEPPRAESLHKRYPREEIWIPVTCGVHPWMRSYLSVVSHPFFAVTGKDGSFAMDAVPSGTYVIESIQEKLGKREQQITVGPQATATVDFVYGD